jgi:hypothetical protein
MTIFYTKGSPVVQQKAFDSFEEADTWLQEVHSEITIVVII